MKSRVALFVLVLIAWVGGVGFRLYRVQISEHASYRLRAEGQHYTEVRLTPPRGTIYDRQGRKLAASVEVDSVYLRLQGRDAEQVARAISPITGESVEALVRRLRGGGGWIARQVEPEVASALRALGLSGAEFVKESKRSYPLGALAGPLLGFVGTDHTGLAGLEAAYDEVVSGERVDRTVLRDARRGRAVAPGMAFLDAEPGDDLHLTIDAGVQYVVERELARAIETHSARWGAAVLMDPHSGAVLAMASLPSFDPNRFADSAQENWRNRVIQDAYEPGSTLKMVTAAAVLEGDVLDPMDILDCEMGSITLGRTRIRDHKPFGRLSFREVISRSSNVGAIKAGLRVGSEPLARHIEAFGFGTATGIDLLGENRGIVRPVDRWSRYEVAYASMGHGLSVTPIQLARAFATVANGGRLVRPYVVSQIGSRAVEMALAPPQPLLSPATHRTLLRLLEAVIEEGTGAAAAIPGYSAAGKTGTAQKVVDGMYANDLHVASFAGFVPSRQPRVVGVVVIDEPKGAFHGGEVAAPVFSAILNQALPLLGVAPDLRPEAASPPLIAAAELPAARQERVARLPVATRPAPGTVPDFAGLSARQALELANESGVGLELEGSGFVRFQRPLAGTRLDSAENVLLHLEAGRRG